MILVTTPIAGLTVIEAELHHDERGAFVRTFAAEVFGTAGLNAAIVQCSVSTNLAAGTLRGLHFQRPPYAEAKLVRCTRGQVWDVAVDLRRNSPTFCQWFGIDLVASSHRALFVPEGSAHGFITMQDDSDVFYQISAAYQPAYGAGVRWDDPTFGITWPRLPSVMAERDAHFPDFDPDRHLQ